MKLLSIKILIIFIISIINLNAQNSIIDYFSEEINSSKSIGFKIVDAKFKLKTIFGRKKLKLKKYKIEEIYPNIYKLTLYFKKKKGIFQFKEKTEIYFYYNKKIIAFKTDYGKKRYELNLFNNVKYIIRFKRCMRKITPVRYSFKLKMKEGKIYLTFEFFDY